MAVRKKIKSVNFGLMSSEMVRKLSAVKIITPDTYDEDGYPIEGGLMDTRLGIIDPGLHCKTCGGRMKTCPGHSGHIELVRPVIHVGYAKKIYVILKATCSGCSKILLPDEKIASYKELLEDERDISDRVLAKVKKASKCPHCNAEQEDIKFDKPHTFFEGKRRIYPAEIRERLERISDDDLSILGWNPVFARPEWMILTALLVPPVTVRPSITLESGVRSEDDLTHKMVDVLRINQRLVENIDAGAPQLIIEDLWDLLQYHITTYFDNESSGIPPARHRSGRALKTVAQRLKGKEGRFRYNLTGKRVNFAGRTVVSPDCFLGINQVGIPERVAEELTVPVGVTEHNIDLLREIVLSEEYPKANYIIRPDKLKKKVTDLTREAIAEELEEGYVVERQLVEGDIVLFNRQPSLHRVSMMAHEAKVTPNKTFSFNTLVCPAYNADFDGDEMNLHVPQTVEAQVEARELLLVENQIISPRYGRPIIAADEDPVAGGFLLTRDVKEYTKEEAMHYSFLIGVKTLPKPDRGEKYSGRLIFSQILPPGINIEFKNGFCEKCEECKKENCKNDAFVSIKDSLLVSGAIDEYAVGERKGVLLDSIFKYIGAKEARDFLDRFMKLSNTVLSREGLTVSSSDYDLSDRIKEEVKQMTFDAEEEINQIVADYKSGTMESIPGMTEEESFDMRILNVTGLLKKKVEGFVGDSLFTFKSESADSVHQAITGSAIMAGSGARANITNLTNNAAIWGQATVNEGRPKRGYIGRVLPIFEVGDVSSRAGGFIENGFKQGLTTQEFFFQAMGARQGEVDKSVSTQESGYLYRRLSNALQDVLVKDDCTVRSASGGLVQVVYGEDGIFPMNLFDAKNLYEQQVKK